MAKNEFTATGIPIPSDFTPYQVEWMKALDKSALEIGAQIKRDHPAPAELRERAAEYERRGMRWLAGSNLQLAEQLERDVRLTAIIPMIAQSHGDGGRGKFFIPQYRILLVAHLDAQERQLQAAE